ncbi:PP2C family protein-serine/threonine phosphatase [Aquipuribacter sp. SD81]|uniref:PP2C family protein-serine/threonine phosphatase n=1 Tax=Aquipuribacter sp. SD81 TaxID=3127703 RepID=UPI0030162CC0
MSRLPRWGRVERPLGSVVLPLLLVAGILVADHLEGPKTAFVGVLVAVPMLSAVFGRPLTVAGVGAVTILAAWLYGQQAADGQVSAQVTRLVVLAVLTVVAVLVAAHRVQGERTVARAQRVVEAVTDAIIRPMPERVGPVRVAARYLGADAEADLGGDFYDVVATPFGVRVVVGDVRGKGLGAVRLANYVLGSFRDAARREPELRDVVAALEMIVATEGGSEDFVTAVVLEVGDGTVTGVSCGHPQPLLLACDGGHREGGLPVDVPLGLGAGTARPAGLAHPAPGGILLHSDGLTEARGSDGRFLEVGRVLRPLGGLESDALLDAVVASLREHVGGRLRDDVALLWLDVLPSGPVPGPVAPHWTERSPQPT